MVRIALHFVDGERGDDAPVPDGIIVDVGGPGAPPQLPVLLPLAAAGENE